MFRLFDPKTPIDFIGRQGLGLKVSGTLFALTVILLLVRGINWGVDFVGGTEMQVKFQKEVSTEDIRQVLDDAGFDKKQVQSYGTPEQHEMLIGVERVTTLKQDEVEKLRGLLQDNLATLSPGGEGEVTVLFSEGEGDRVAISLPLPPPQQDTAAPTPPPAPVAANDAGPSDTASATETPAAEPPATEAPAADTATAQAKRIDKQEAELARLIDEKSGYKLRRTKKAGEAESTTEDAIIAEDAYQGRVKYLVYFQGISSEIEKALSTEFGQVEIRRVDYVDSKVAEQLRTDGVLAIVLALLGILIYIAIRFDIYFAPGAVVALIHDSIIALAIFPLTWREFDLPSIAAILTVVGYSINDTIVTYDRVREIVPAEKRDTLSESELKHYVNQGINDTFSRTIITGLTTLLATLSLAIFATGAVQTFAIVLTVGILLGAWSTIMIAPATYFFLRRNFHSPSTPTSGLAKRKSGLSREDKARGVV